MPMETFVKLMPILYSTRRTLNSSIAASNASQCIMHDIDCALHCLKELQLTIKSSIETRELNTVRGHMMHPPRHACNRLASPADSACYVL